MGWPLRTRLLAGFVGVVVVTAALTVPAGSILINRMVLGEAQRRVDLALKTADNMLRQELAEAQDSCTSLAETVAARAAAGQETGSEALEELRQRRGYDFVHLVEPSGRVVAAARGRAAGREAGSSPVVAQALATRAPAAGVGTMPLEALRLESESLASRAAIAILPTPRAKPGTAERLERAMVLEVACPVAAADGHLLYAARLGTVINGNFEFVDRVRQNVFTVSTYRGKNLGTVTIFQGDVRIATNVKGPDGKRAVGTRVSAEVFDQVLGQGERWTGPAFVVDSWYLSAYEALRDVEGTIVGMLYVGVLKDRYDDMRNEAVRILLGIGLLALVVAVGLASWLSAHLARPLVSLTAGAAEVARGNLDHQFRVSGRSQRDEIEGLTAAFNQMVAALRERDEQLRRSNRELQQWVQNYLDILEFITHELKNQIAAMKINLLAVHDGYVGAISEDQKAALSDVAETIDRSEEMILNYLNLSRIEQGELQFHAMALQLEPDVIRPMLNDLRGRLEARELQVEVELPDELAVLADPSLLRTVFANLISNAAKYGRQGGRVRVWAEPEGGLVRLHVWNDGPGVEAGKVGRLFCKFTRLQAPSDEQPGTGLGLFITREIIRRHGGEIRVENRPGEWIDFVFTLPMPDVPERS